MTRRHWITAAGIATAGLLGFQLGRFQPAPPAETVETAGDRPLIGISSLSNDACVRAIRESGGIPVVLPDADGSPGMIGHYLGMLDGLLMPGGADIPPSEYGEEAHPTVRVLDEDRATFEKALGRAWIERTDKPLLGICLGGQWINVLHGGSLVQDIPSEFGLSHRDTTHPVKLAPDSRLARIMGATELQVNSSHHQAVRTPGTGLRVAARSPEGLVEAIETTDPDRFLIGVQWHPERMVPGDPAQIRLLRAFVDACRIARPPPQGSGAALRAGANGKPVPGPGAASRAGFERWGLHGNSRGSSEGEALPLRGESLRPVLVRMALV